MPDSLKWTSALAVALAVVFVVIVVAVTLWKLVAGEINWPRLTPNVYDLKSIGGLFTAIPVMMTAYICHHNGKFLLASPFSVSLPSVPLRVPI